MRIDKIYLPTFVELNYYDPENDKEIVKGNIECSYMGRITRIEMFYDGDSKETKFREHSHEEKGDNKYVSSFLDKNISFKEKLKDVLNFAVEIKKNIFVFKDPIFYDKGNEKWMKQELVYKDYKTYLKYKILDEYILFNEIEGIKVGEECVIFLHRQKTLYKEEII